MYICTHTFLPRWPARGKADCWQAVLVFSDTSSFIKKCCYVHITTSFHLHEIMPCHHDLLHNHIFSLSTYIYIFLSTYIHTYLSIFLSSLLSFVHWASCSWILILLLLLWSPYPGKNYGTYFTSCLRRCKNAGWSCVRGSVIWIWRRGRPNIVAKRAMTVKMKAMEGMKAMQPMQSNEQCQLKACQAAASIVEAPTVYICTYIWDCGGQLRFWKVMSGNGQWKPGKKGGKGKVGFTYVYVHICICICTYIHTYIHTYMFCDVVFRGMRIMEKMHVADQQPHVAVQAGACTYTHAYVCTYVHACIHTYVHTYIHTYIHTYAFCSLAVVEFVLQSKFACFVAFGTRQLHKGDRSPIPSTAWRSHCLILKI